LRTKQQKRNLDTLLEIDSDSTRRNPGFLFPSIMQSESWPMSFRFLLSAILILTFAPQCSAQNVPVVVLDPGHGGRVSSPLAVYGDKYDAITGKYQDKFRPGAYYKGIWENEAMYDIVFRAREILNLTLEEETQPEFEKILSRYGKASGGIKPVQAHLSREQSAPDIYFDIRKDLNAPYRLFDYPDIETEKHNLGTISRINALKPQLVVSVHLTASEGGRNGAMAAVITPGYKTFNIARDYANSSAAKRRELRQNFLRSQWGNWFIAAQGYDPFESFLCDAWIYYTGGWSNPSGLSPKKDSFRGYRQNMISWSYADDADWWKQAGNHPKGTRYDSNLSSFKPDGPFWKRETSQPESWRREGGPEGYGGDNFYASQEIMRYMQTAFIQKGIDTEATSPELRKPYLSTWSVPTYVNAVAAYLEIAHLLSSRDRMRMTKHRDVYAEGLAVGVYSLVYPVEIKSKGKNRPIGKPVDFQKYKSLPQGNYFEAVVKEVSNFSKF